MGWYYGWKPYVSVAQRRRQALKEMEALRKKGLEIQPVEIRGRKIAATFWGAAWCDHLESFSDFANRLPRGRTYVRNGSVCHLEISRGRINAKVSGSEIYDVTITMPALAKKKWDALKRRCGSQIGSLVELLQGRLSEEVMGVVTDREAGLFPLPGEIHLQCSCPDWATMCKHVAAVLYGVGARLDRQPELLFLLRGVNHEELIAVSAEQAVEAATSRGKSKRLAASRLSEVFGIELEAEPGTVTMSDDQCRAEHLATQSAPKPAQEKPSRMRRTAKKKSVKAKNKAKATKVIRSKVTTNSAPSKKTSRKSRSTKVPELATTTT